MMKKQLKGEYAVKGEYHKCLDKNWKFYPIYVEKMVFIKNYVSRFSKNKKIIDAGCGEGILVGEFKKKGFDIIGLDYNYASKNVIKGSITNMKFKKESFDLVLCLDVIEHLTFEDQEKAVKEIFRITKKNGKVMISVPNLAHFASRISFLFLGKLLRPSSVDRHKGERPISEYKDLFKKHGLRLESNKGLFPTYPISSLLTYFFPSKVVFLHKFLNRFLAYPNWCLLNIMELKKNVR